MNRICNKKNGSSVLMPTNCHLCIKYNNDSLKLGTAICICMNGLLFRMIALHEMDCKELIVSIYQCASKNYNVTNIHSDIKYIRYDPRFVCTTVIKYIGVQFKNMTDDQILRLKHLISVMRQDMVYI